MAEYKSQFSNLGFYVKDTLKTFSNGTYATDDKKEIEILDKLTDVQRIDEPKTEEAPKSKPKAPVKKASAK